MKPFATSHSGGPAHKVFNLLNPLTRYRVRLVKYAANLAFKKLLNTSENARRVDLFPCFHSGRVRRCL